MAETELTFRTKTGTCTIAGDRILLERRGARGRVARALFGSSIRRARALYLLLAGGLAVAAVLAFRAESTGSGSFLTVFAISLAGNVVMSRGLSASADISRADVLRVDAFPPRPPLTRGRFVVHFREDGKDRRRLILLPGSLSGGGAEYERAVALLRGEGLLSP